VITYKQKIILEILRVYGKLNKLLLQKICFLLNKEHNIPIYDFVPYKYGPFSFTLNNELFSLQKKGLIELNENSVILKQSEDKTKLELDYNVIETISDVYRRFGNDKKSMINYIYKKFPYYTQRSKLYQRFDVNIKNEKKVNENEIKKINENKKYLFTIGYEGKSLERFLNLLIQNEIDILVDVRNNPISRKFGFSKEKLKSFCEKLFIEYVHLPQLGIPPEYRKHRSYIDLQKLFDFYYKNILLKNIDVIYNILFYLKNENKRLAVMCFERDVNFCHRKFITNEIEQISKNSIKITHL
jgi:uncharacterized protein (DUF488 family)